MYKMVTLDYFVKLGDDSWGWLDQLVVISPRPLLPFLDYYETKISSCDDVQHLFNSIIKIADVTTGPLFGGGIVKLWTWSWIM